MFMTAVGLGAVAADPDGADPDADTPPDRVAVDSNVA
jgi:hypothetical protein